MAGLQIEMQPASEPVTLLQAKSHLRVSITDDDDYINGILIPASREAVESFTNRSLCTKGYIQTFDSFPYYTDSTVSQNAYPPSYYALSTYSTTMWNYSQMIKLFASSPNTKVQRLTYIGTDGQYRDMLPAPPLWYPGTVTALNDIVMDGNGNQQKCTFAGTTSSAPPTWNQSLGGTTTETDVAGEEGSGPVTWQNLGPLPKEQTDGVAGFGLFVVDTVNEPNRIFPVPGQMWPAVMYVPNAVQIHFTSGYSADGSKVPGRAKTAMLQAIGNWYEHREAAEASGYKELPYHTQMLLWSLRIYDVQPTRS